MLKALGIVGVAASVAVVLTLTTCTKSRAGEQDDRNLLGALYAMQPVCGISQRQRWVSLQLLLIQERRGWSVDRMAAIGAREAYSVVATWEQPGMSSNPVAKRARDNFCANIQALKRSTELQVNP